MSAIDPILLRINGKWSDVSVWAKSHPGGAECLKRFHEHDATDAFMSLHSKEALAKWERMPARDKPKEYKEETTKVTQAFRLWREQLEKDGWFDRDWKWDAFYIGSITLMSVIGTLLAWTHPIIATILLGVAMQQAGWIGHDYVHGRGTICYILGRIVGGGFNGFSSEWWSDKHNTHHVHTNQLGVDMDIQNDPILHLWIPEKDNDFVGRPYQHLYYHIVYAFLYVSWRIQSFQYAWERANWLELAIMAVNYTWLVFFLPAKVAIGSVVLGGWFVAEIVTATHQSEEILTHASYNYCEDQFKTTRDVHMDSSVANWFWGGMQFQLIHHLFPTMPKYRYSAMVPHIEAFAKKNGIEYKHSTAWEIWTMNYQTMKKFAEEAKA